MAVGEATAWRAVLVSRLVVWVAGVGAVLVWGLHDRNAVAFDPTGLTRPFGSVGDDLVAPAARWDTVWFEHIAREGYDAQRAAFFPLYPMLVRILGAVVGSDLVAGIVLSLACFTAALVLLERLVALDFDRDVARLTVWLVALFPGAVWFSAVYSEGLFLLLSVAAVWWARTDRWALAGLAGGLAAATRSAGLVLLVPLALLWWRARRPARDAAWLLLVPAGLLAYCAGLALGGHGFTAPFHAQEAWSRTFAGPFGAVPRGLADGWSALSHKVSGVGPPRAAFDLDWVNLGYAVTLLAAAVALAGALRRLPLAYGAYALAALLLALSYPVDGVPLMSLPRFVAVLWPLHLWFALWLSGRAPAWRHGVLVVSALGLAAVSAEVATWGWVA